jgi:hypothetical protein
MSVKNKKIAITGHMNGLGKGLFDSLSKNNQCKGFDILNDYDIDRDIDRILDESIDCEIFINNAYYLDRQTDLAKKWHLKHWNLNHLIINISTALTDPWFDGRTFFPHLEEYIKEKESLDHLSAQINFSDSICKSSTILPGMLYTKFKTPYDTDQPDPEITTNLCQKIFDRDCIMHVEDIVPVIESIIEQNFHPRRIISTVIIHNR